MEKSLIETRIRHFSPGISLDRISTHVLVSRSRRRRFCFGSSPPAISSRDLAGDDSALDPSILAFDELVEKSLSRVSVAAKKIGRKVLEATKLLEEAFAVEKDLIVNAKKCKVAGTFGYWIPNNTLWLIKVYNQRQPHINSLLVRDKSLAEKTIDKRRVHHSPKVHASSEFS